MRMRLFRLSMPLIRGIFLGTVLRWIFRHGELREVCLQAILVVGASCNWLAIKANGFKMPVAGINTDTVTHSLMTPETKHKWACDVLNVGIGKASVGDLLIFASMLLRFNDLARHFATFLFTHGYL